MDFKDVVLAIRVRRGLVPVVAVVLMALPVQMEEMRPEFLQVVQLAV